MRDIIEKLIKTKADLDIFLENYFYSKKNLNLTYFNQHSFNLAYTDKNFLEILKGFNIYQEGIGNFIALKFLGYKIIDRIDSTEVLYRIFKNFSSKNNRVFIIGDNISQEILETVTKEKKLNLVGYHSGYYTDDEVKFIVKKIQDAKAEFIVIGMGSPKQEYAVIMFRQFLAGENFLCVGNFLRFYFGLQKRAPKWMRTLQLEWFYRFLLEPKRLFKRYIIGIPVFFWRVFLLKFISRK
jgi:N-acetylglucosaminyldiphosphoundecaprenol N-acetyl-beta-D-mannosaminyltransferase